MATIPADLIPVAREWRAVKRRVERGGPLEREEIKEVFAGLLALAAVIGTVIMLSTRDTVPGGWWTLVGGIGTYYFVQATISKVIPELRDRRAATSSPTRRRSVRAVPLPRQEIPHDE